MPITHNPPERSALFAKKSQANATACRSIFFVLAILLIGIPAGVLPFSFSSGEIQAAASRGFGDPGNDTTIESVNTHSGGMTYALQMQEINITLANYNDSFAINVTVNFTVKCIDTGQFEAMANTSGNVSDYMIPINSTRNHSLWWTPSQEGNFSINITTTNEAGWPDDPDLDNNYFNLTVKIQNMTDVGAEISSLEDGKKYEMGSFPIEAWVNNTGNRKNNFRN